MLVDIPHELEILAKLFFGMYRVLVHDFLEPVVGMVILEVFLDVEKAVEVQGLLCPF